MPLFPKDRLLFLLQQGSQTGERLEGGNRLSIVARCGLFIPFPAHVPRVLVVVAEKAEELPVAPVRRIVTVVVILVMDGELTKSLA